MQKEWRPGITLSFNRDGTPHAAVVFDPDAFLRHGDEMVRQFPLTRLSLSKAGARIADLAGHPVVQRMSELRLYDLGDDGLAALAGVDLPALRVLGLARSGVRGAGLTALAGALWTARLQALDLDRNDLGDPGATSLAAAPLGRLRSLSLKGTGIGSAGAGALAAAAWMPAVEVLGLGENHVGPQGGVAVARILPPGPVDLDLRKNALDTPAAAALAAAPWRRLERIGLSDNSFPGDDIVEYYDWDGSSWSGHSLLEPDEIGKRLGFRGRGVEVY